jgi:hypothetical protein
MIDKEASGLFKIHIHVTDSGFIFGNFSAAPIEPTSSEGCGSAALVNEASHAMIAFCNRHIPISLNAERNVSKGGAVVPQWKLYEKSADSENDTRSESDLDSVVTAPDCPSSEEGEPVVPKTPEDNVLPFPCLPFPPLLDRNPTIQ